MNMLIIQVTFAVAMLAFCGGAKTGKMERALVRMDITGKSGRIQLYTRQSVNDTKVSKHPIIIQIDSLIQRDESGTEVCDTGSNPYSVKSFASQEFTVSAASTGSVPNTVSLPADIMSFSTTVKGHTSTITVHVYMVKQDGDVTLGDEVETLKDGQMKFSVELTNWKWCTTLVSGAARFVDVTISIKSKKAPEKGEKKAKKPTVYELGNDAEISLSQKVKVDGVWKDMATGFPKLGVRGTTNLFTFRLPGFNDTVLYDPTVSSGNEDGDDTSHAPSAPSAGIALTLLAAILSLFRLL